MTNTAPGKKSSSDYQNALFLALGFRIFLFVIYFYLFQTLILQIMLMKIHLNQLKMS